MLKRLPAVFVLVLTISGILCLAACGSHSGSGSDGYRHFGFHHAHGD